MTLGELNIGEFSYEAGTPSEAFLRQVPVEVLQERVMFQQDVRSGRRLAHTFDLRCGAKLFWVELSEAGTTFRHGMKVTYGVNKSANGIPAYYTVSLVMKARHLESSC